MVYPRAFRAAAVMLIFIFVICIGGTALAEGATMDFSQKLASGQKLRIVTYGTSLTAEGSSFWVANLKTILSSRYPRQATVINSGQGAMWSGWGVDNLDSRVIKKNPDVVFIEFGINDANIEFKMSLDDCRRAVENMVGRIRKANPGCEIILMTMNYPVREHLLIRPDVEKYYQVYRDIAREQGLKLIDIFPRWKEIYSTAPALYDYYVPDGIHPARAGTRFVIIPTILSSFEDLKGLVPDMLKAGKYTDAKSIKATFGEKDEYLGLTRIVAGTEDKTVVENVSGEQGRKNGEGSSATYFNVEDDWIKDVSTSVTAVIRYLDAGSGWFRVDYDSTDPKAPGGGANKASSTVNLTNTGAWKTVSLPLSGVRFDGRQYKEGDLCITVLKGTQVLVGSIELVKNTSAK